MLLVKEGLPEESELLMCTVTKVHFHSVFVSVDEYNKPGMIHISEIAPGRIRNIRDYVVEGKVVVCKVLRVNEERGHIDLSLRRVSEGARREKVNHIKNEQKAEKILEVAAKAAKLDPKKVFYDSIQKVLDKYENLHDFFADVAEDKASLDKFGFPKEIIKSLKETIVTRIKPKEIKIGGKLSLKTYEPDGVERIKKILQENQKQGNSSVIYEGGGKYSMSVTSTDYKDAEKILGNAVASIEKAAKASNIETSFARK
jgi:translation initiation factor 2 subunit 1